MRRCFALFLALAMVFGMMPVTAFAQETELLPIEEETSAPETIILETEAPAETVPATEPILETTAPITTEPVPETTAPILTEPEETVPAEVAGQDSASEEAVAATSGTCGTNVTWTLNNGTLTISGSGAMINYTYNSTAPWYGQRGDVTSVVVGTGVTSIGSRVFEGCSSLSSIEIPNSVTRIGDYAFYGCSSLSSIEIPNSVTSIGSSAFEDCSSLSSIEIPNSVTSIGYWAFLGCSSLSSIEIPNSVTSISDFAFADCSSLSSIEMPNSVTSIGYGTFADCSSLSSIEIPNSVTSIGDYAFSGCSSLRQITFVGNAPTFGTSVFSDVTATVRYPSGNSTWTSSVRQNYGGTITWQSYTPQTTPSNSCGDNLTWELEDGVLTISGSGAMKDYSSGSDVPWHNQRSTITDIVVGSGVTSIGRYAFGSCNNLTSIELPASLNCIGDAAFMGCDSLTSIELPASLASIGESAFRSCTSLSSIELPAGLTSIGESAFRTCYRLSSIVLPANLNCIGNDAFYWCDSLSQITFTGNAPTFGTNVFGDVTATVRYPSGNSTWTSAVRQNYGGTITWQSYTPTGSGATSAPYTITYNANGGSDAPSSRNTSISGSLTLSSDVLTKTGYTFLGWATSASAATASYLPGRSYTFSGNTTLYAVWQAATVMPTDVTNSNYSATVAFAGGYQMYSYRPTTTRQLTFESSVSQDTAVDILNSSGTRLATDDDGGVNTNFKLTHTFNANTQYYIKVRYFNGSTVTGSITFSVKAAVTTYTVTYHPNDGSNIVRTDEVTNPFTVVEQIPEKDGYVFQGWSSSASATTVTHVPGSSYPITADLDLYAVWQAESPTNPSGTCGTNLTWELVDGVLTISGTGAMTNYRYISDDEEPNTPWVSHCGSIRSVVVGSGVTGLGTFAFYGCQNLTSVELPDSVTSIGGYAFGNCSNLTSLEIPNAVTGIGECTFKGCSSLCSVELPNSLNSINAYAFDGCSSLISLEIPSGVTSIGENAFYNCSSLRSIELPRGLTRIEDWTFYSCSSLANLEIPSGVTRIGKNAFYHCESLTSLEIPSGVTRIGDGAFWGCSGLRSLEIPSGVTSIGNNMFYACSSLSSIDIPDGVTSIGDDAFGWCSSMAQITFAGNAPTFATNVFYGVTATVRYPDGNSTWTSSVRQNYGGNITWVSYVPPYTITYNANGGSGAPEAMQIEIGDSIEISNTIPVRSGYRFVGWYTSAEANSNGIPAGEWKHGTITPDGDMTLYAHWIPETFLQYGDLNLDGVINVNDIVRANNFVANGTIPNGLNAELLYLLADLTRDSAVTEDDLTILNALILGNTNQLELHRAYTRTVIRSLPQTEYQSGESLDTEGLAIGIEFNTGLCYPISSGLTVTGFDPDKSGNQTLAVSYHQFTASYDINMAPHEHSYTETVTPPNCTEQGYTTHICRCGDSFEDSYTEALGHDYVNGQCTRCLEVPAYTIEVRSENGLDYLPDGKTLALEAWRMPENQKMDVQWQITAGAGHASVRDDGLVTAGAVGVPQNVTVTAVNPEDGVSNSMTLLILPKNTALTLKRDGQTVSALGVDIKHTQTLELTVEAGGRSLSNAALTWSAGTGGVVSVENGTVTIHKTGTAAITVRDTYGLTGTASLNVYYVDTAKKLTAVTDIPAIGLQQGDTARISVFGDSLIPEEDLLFTSSNVEIVSVDENGILTGGTKTGNAKITAVVQDDPMKRSTVVSIKVIPAQTRSLTLTPEDLVLDKTELTTPASRTITITAEAEGISGPMTLNAKSLKWTSSNTALAKVKANADGTATVTLTANKDGEALITAQSTDLAKLTAVMRLSVVDRVPKLGSASVTLNPLMESGVYLNLIAGYENGITGVAVEHSGLDVSYNSEDGFWMLFANTDLKNGNINTTVSVICEDGKIYDLPLKVAVKNTVPAITIKQNTKLDLFYTDSQTDLTVTAKNTMVEKLELTDTDDFWMDENGVIRFADDLKAKLAADPKYKPDTKATLVVYLEDYIDPVEKALTITTAKTNMTLATDPASSILNTAMTDDYRISFRILNKTAKTVLDLRQDQVSCSKDFYVTDNGKVTVDFGSPYKGNVDLYVQLDNWMQSVKVTHKVSLDTKLPTTKLAVPTLKINNNFADRTARTEITLNQGNMEIVRFGSFTSTAKAGTPARTEANKITLSYADGIITAQIRRGQMPKAGTYSYTAVPYVRDQQGNEAALKAVTVKVTISTAVPKVTLAAKGKLDTVNPESEIVYTVNTVSEGNLEAVELKQGAELFEISELGRNAQGKPEFTLKLREGVRYATKTAYKIALEYTISGTRYESAVLSVKVTQSALKGMGALNKYIPGEDSVVVSLAITAPENARMAEIRINPSKSAKELLAALDSSALSGNLLTESTAEARLVLPIADWRGLQRGKVYKLALEITPVGHASDAKLTQVTVNIEIAK